MWLLGLLTNTMILIQVFRSAGVASQVDSQLKMVIRPMYSNPPAHEALIAASILGDRYSQFSSRPLFSFHGHSVHLGKAESGL
jgi:hypothetical protein